MTGQQAPHRPGPWVTITDYPRWPSPYFAQFERHLGNLVELGFQPDLRGLAGRPPGVVNLHRLKRLYRDTSNTPKLPLAVALLDDLATLASLGWRIVWTIHNLYPIDVSRQSAADRTAVSGLLRLADAIMCHTDADARHVRRRPEVRDRPEAVGVCGWAGPPGPRTRPLPANVARIRAVMREQRAFLMLGNITAYKDVPTVVRAFLQAAPADTHLHVVGPGHDGPTEIAVAESIKRGDRVHRWPGQIDAGCVADLHDAALAAVCNYRPAAGQRFFRHALHPASVGTAIAYAVPVIAPDLPSVREMTEGHPRFLFRSPRTLTTAFEKAAASPDTRGRRRTDGGDERWSSIAASHARVARQLLTWRQRADTTRGNDHGTP